MATLAERILSAIRYAPLDDDVLAARLGVPQRQSVNQTARKLEAQGRLRRIPGPEGKIVNALVEGEPHPSPPPSIPQRPVDESRITEDEVKTAVRDHLRTRGFAVEVAWGRQRGIDLDARRPDGARVVVEAKGEGPRGAQQHNYFVGALGELVQRIEDDNATYALALPDHPQYRGLVSRLPAAARRRLGLVVFWVSRADDELRVVEDQPPT